MCHDASRCTRSAYAGCAPQGSACVRRAHAYAGQRMRTQGALRTHTYAVHTSCVRRVRAVHA
jgi:hypothetical protein